MRIDGLASRNFTGAKPARQRKLATPAPTQKPAHSPCGMLFNDCTLHADAWRRSGSGIHGDYRRHLMLATGGELHRIVGDVPRLDAHHAAPSGVTKVGQGGSFLGPRVPHHRRRGAALLDHDAPAPTAILDGAPRGRIEVCAVGLRPDGDELRNLPLPPARFRLVDVSGAVEPGDP